MKFKYIIVLLVMVSSFVACDPNDTIEDYSTETVSPVGEIRYGDKVISIGDGTPGETAMKFYTGLTDIQYGKAEDSENWIEVVD